MATNNGSGVSVPGTLMHGAPHFNEGYMNSQLQGKLGATEYVTPDRLPEHPVARVVGTLRRLWRADSMADVASDMASFTRDVIYDVNLVMMQRKGHMRLWLWLSHALGTWDFQPLLIQVRPLGSRSIVHITATEAFFPRRSLLLPATYLLPRRVEFATDITACVLGDLQSGKIEWVQVHPHNAPKLPAPLRGALGQLLAFPLHATEPLWSMAPWQLLGESFWAERRRGAAERQQISGADGTLLGAGGRAGLVGDDAFDAAIDFASSGYKGLVFGAQRAADSAYDATASARHGAAAAYSTAAGAASKVTDAASKAAEAVTGTAKHAADAVTGTAKHAAEAAAEAASKAAQAAKETAGGAYESVAGAVGAH